MHESNHSNGYGEGVKKYADDRTMNTIGAASGEAIRQAPVDAALDGLEIGVKRAYDQFDQLVSRLKPALQGVAGAAKSESKTAPASCMLEGRITELAETVHELAGRIQSIRAALCI